MYEVRKYPKHSGSESLTMLRHCRDPKDIKILKIGDGYVIAAIVDGAGKLRFKYKGNFNVTFMLNIFSPSDIVTDINNLILISYGCTTIDVIDSDGNFLRYLYYSCSGGMSIDIDNNLVVGDSKDGKIKIIKYLQ